MPPLSQELRRIFDSAIRVAVSKCFGIRRNRGDRSLFLYIINETLNRYLENILQQTDYGAYAVGIDTIAISIFGERYAEIHLKLDIDTGESYIDDFDCIKIVYKEE